MQIKCFTFGPFETNTYVVSSFPSGEDGRGFILLIDPACSNEYERQQLERYIDSQPFREGSGLGSLTIVATHGHLDHLWGAKWATERWNTPVLMHEADIPMAEAMQQQYNLFGIRATAEAFPIEPLTLSSIHPVTIIHTPGHTPGSICLYRPSLQGGDGVGFLLSGDTLFHMGYGRTDLPGGNMGQLITSLEHLFELPADTRVFPGHGDFTTIGAEKRC